MSQSISVVDNPLPWNDSSVDYSVVYPSESKNDLRYDERRCTVCKTMVSDLSGFYTMGHDKKGQQRYTSECRVCANKRSIKWAKNNPKKIKIINNRWKEKNPKSRYAGCAFDRAARRAKQKKIPFSITKEFLCELVSKRDYCVICGITLTYHKNEKHYSYKSFPSLDRVIPKLGYTNKNIDIICYLCNTIKSNLLLEDVEVRFPQILAYLRSHGKRITEQPIHGRDKSLEVYQ